MESARESHSSKLSTGSIVIAPLHPCLVLFPTHRAWLTSCTLRAQRVGPKGLCCRMLTVPALLTGAPTYFNRTKTIGFPRMLHFTSTSQFLTFTFHSSMALRWCWLRSNWVRIPLDWHRGLLRRKLRFGTR